MKFDYTSYLYCFIAIFFFSTTELVGKWAGLGISPIVVTIIRFFIGSALLLPFVSVNKLSPANKLSAKDILLISYPGIINVAGAMLLLQIAINYGKASTSAMLISSNPIFVAIFAAFILKEKLSLKKVIGIVMGLSGVFLVIGGDNNPSVMAPNPLLGIIFALMASINFGLYTVLAKKKIATYGNLFFNTVSFSAGALFLLIISVIFNLDFTFEMTANNILLLLYMGVFITGIAYIFFFAGLKNIPTANGSMMFFFKPIIASLLAFFFLGETITPIQIIGIVFIVTGIYVTNVTKRGSS